MIYRMLIVGLLFCLSGPVYAQSLLDRVSALEEYNKTVHRQLGNINARLDRIEARLDMAPVSQKAAGCDCGCLDGGDCTCTNCPSLAWYSINGNNSGDMVLFRDDIQIGYWKARDQSYQSYDARSGRWGQKRFFRQRFFQRGTCSAGGCSSGG